MLILFSSVYHVGEILGGVVFSHSSLMLSPYVLISRFLPSKDVREVYPSYCNLIEGFFLRTVSVIPDAGIPAPLTEHSLCDVKGNILEMVGRILKVFEENNFVRFLAGRFLKARKLLISHLSFLHDQIIIHHVRFIKEIRKIYFGVKLITWHGNFLGKNEG